MSDIKTETMLDIFNKQYEQIIWDIGGNEVDFNTYQELTGRTAGKFESQSEELVAWTMGVGGESGEIVDYVKKVIFHGHPLDREKLKLEIGDNLYYLARLANLLNYSLEEVAKANIEKLKKRYPEGFSTERSVNRAD